MKEESDGEEVLEELESIIQDTDEKYDQQKIDEAFPPKPLNLAPAVQALEQAVKPPLVLQKVIVTFSNGRVGEFMGNAVMTVDEFRNAKGSFRPTLIDFAEPVVVKADE